MRDSVRHFVAEFVGVFALVFVGSGSILMARATNSPNPLLNVALATGLVLGVMVTATMRSSGHLNPAVTAAFLATRRIEPMMGGLFIVAQLLGTLAGGYALEALTPQQLFDGMQGGIQSISIDVSASQAFFLEAVATFILVFVTFATAVDPRSPTSGGLAIGLAMAVGILAVGPLTGGSMNPARSFGPAVAAGAFEGQIVFWTGPLVGALVAGALYEVLFLRAPAEPFDHGAVRPDRPGRRRGGQSEG